MSQFKYISNFRPIYYLKIFIIYNYCYKNTFIVSLQNDFKNSY